MTRWCENRNDEQYGVRIFRSNFVTVIRFLNEKLNFLLKIL